MTRRKPYYTPGAAARRRSRKRISNWISVATVAAIALLCFLIFRHPASASDSKYIRENLHYPDAERAVGAPAYCVEKDYEGFCLSFDPYNHTPRWVAWELLGSETDGPVSRGNNFHADSEVEGCPLPSDYTRSGFDRGHLCPAADQKWSSQAMSDCFFMTNMAPQHHRLNSGAWKTLEEKERLWARRDSALLIVAGPIYSAADSQRVGQSGVRVPSGFYKCIVAPYINRPRGIAFVYNNDHCPGNMVNYACTIDEVEKLTGLDFFAALPDEIENEVESNYFFKSWDQQ